MPFVDSLRKESIVYPRAASTSPWTLPSHASIFTGLSPWKHGCHGKGSLILPPASPRVSSTLRGLGYRTLSLSANPIISPEYGLVDGFDQATWGNWWERSFPFGRAPPHTAESIGAPMTPESRIRPLREKIIRTTYTMGKRVPASHVAMREILRRMRFPDDPDWRPNAWLEPALRMWLGRQPRSTPVFGFINLMDAHEPYLITPRSEGSWGRWWRDMTIPQDSLSLLAGQQVMSEESLRRLHDLYRLAIQRIDQRILRIVDAFREAGRWENTLLAITADHGQAFGERGMIWHGIRPEEAELRVPLWLRLPLSESGGPVGRGWASPQDLPATILRALNGGGSGFSDSVPLQDLIDRPRPNPLICVTDGTTWNAPLARRLPSDRLNRLDQIFGVAYSGNWKVVVNASSGTMEVYDIDRDPKETRDLQREVGADVLAPLSSAARSAADELLRPSTRAASDAQVDARLRSWGYV
jgi:arylsulfatase A-like enzyme